MIATSETPWSDHYLRPGDATHPQGNRKMAEGLDPFRFRQRARSMSDFGAPDPLPNEQLDVGAYEINPMDPLSHPNPSPLLGYFMQQDAYFRESAHRNMGLTPGPEVAETDGDFTSIKFESLDFSDHSRPVSSISSNTSSFSSTLLDDYTPPTPCEKPNITSFTQKQNLTPPDDDDEPERYFSHASTSPSFIQGSFSNQWIPNSSSGPMVSPLERMFSLSHRRPSITTRQRSGTVLPPKKPEIIPEDLNSVSSSSLTAQPISPKPEDKPTRPPARPPRPPRSYLREISTKKVDSSQQVSSGINSHDKVAVEASNSGLESAAIHNLHSSSAMSAVEERSIYGSARSNPAPLPSPEPSPRQSHFDPTSKLQKGLPENTTATVKLHPDDSPPRPSVLQRASSRTSARASHTPLPKATGASADRSPSSKPLDSPVTSKVTDDESDEFESADEGDEQFWSVAQGFDHQIQLGVTRISDGSTDRTEKPTKKSPLIPSSSSEPAGEKISKRAAQGPRIKTSDKPQLAIIGAFPRSESSFDSSMSSSVSNLTPLEDTSTQEPLPPTEATLPISPRDKVGTHRPRQPSSSSQVTPNKSPSRRKMPPRIEIPSPTSPPAAEIPPVKKTLPPSPHRAPDLADISPAKPPSESESMTRTRSLEGLAALRSSTSPSAQLQKKKFRTRSSGHLRQLSKIINFCTRDGLMDEQLGEEMPVPISIDLAEHQTRSNQLNNTSPAGSPHHPLSDPHVLSAASWKHSMPLATYEHLKSLYGSLEMRRQEVIWELCKTENSFAVGLRQVIEIFASPLRTPEGNWISGVPVPVAKLLDWLEDIVNLHSQMAFQAKNSRDYQTRALGLVVHISEVFLEVAPKLEMYQPYLVRFGQVTALIEDMVSDPDSDFGEFVRMQTVLPECGKMSLNSFLLKPVQRLMKYPLFFKQLCEVTPPDHPDHATTVCLLNTIDSMIRVLQEVKEREDEYEKLKVLQSKVKGLPPGFILARRDRRLLAQGLLKRVDVSARGRQSVHAASYHHPWAMNPQGTPANMALASPPPNWSHASEMMTSSRSGMSYHGNSSLNSPTSPMSAGMRGIKPPLLNRPERENDGMGFGKYPYPPPLPDSINNNLKQFYDWTVIDKSGERSEDANHYQRTRAQTGTWETELENRYGGRRSNNIDNNNHHNLINKNLNSSSNNRLSKKSKKSPVHVFVFSDLVLLATRHSEGVRLIRTPMVQKKKKDSPYYSALEGLGVSRLIAVSDISGELEYPHLLKLDVLPYGGEVNQLIPPIPILFTFPDRLPGASQLSKYEEVEKERYKWLAAFHQSLRSTDPSFKQTGAGMEEEDPLDPSHPNFEEIPIQVQERHERHWWSNRHRLVAKELELLNEEESSYEPSDLDTNNSSSNSQHSFDSLKVEPSHIMYVMATQN